MLHVRTLLAALLPFALHGLARHVDHVAGVLLHTTLDLPAFVGDLAGMLSVRDIGASIARWTAAGAACWVLLALVRMRREGGDLGAALAAEAGSFAPLYLRPILTLLSLASLAHEPTFPYGFTLPVALTQDWSPAQDVAALATLAAMRSPRIRLPAPRVGEVFFIAFLAYALLTPERARHWDGHPGNEPKYLRMGVALAHRWSLDVGPVSASLEALTPEPIAESAGRAARRWLSESLQMFTALASPREALSAAAVQATRITRQTVRGKDGGTYHVLAPGPSLLLAPTLRLDRWLNLRLGTPGRLSVSILLWNGLAAALVAAVFLLLRDATARPALAAVLAGAFALGPPFLFYFFQFYPELPGALVLALAFRMLLFTHRLTTRTMVCLGLLLATLPWLHQKFLPVWAVLLVMAVVKCVGQMVTLRAIIVLLVPQGVTLFLTALYNFAITGSARPDALFIAWGPRGITLEHPWQGGLGLLLDARYGILPQAPVYLLAIAALALPRATISRLRLALPAAAVYYLTVALADDWHGAVSNLGRYFFPLAPLCVALIGVVLARVAVQRGIWTLALVIAGVTGIIARLLWLDPLAANDGALLMAKSAFADANVYVPNLFVRSWQGRAPGLVAQLVVWLALLLAVMSTMRRALGAGAVRSPVRTLTGLVCSVLAAGFVLERWPSPCKTPRFPDAIELRPGITIFAAGAERGDGGYVRATRGALDVLVRSRDPLDRLVVSASGKGSLRWHGRAPITIPVAGTRVSAPLELVRNLTGRRGLQESLYRTRLDIDSAADVLLRFDAPTPPEAPP